MAALVDILAAGVVDDDGAALVNGVVYFYERGTTTKVTVYQDSDLTIPYSNPLTLDDAGKAEVYIQNPVRIVIEDSSGNLIDDIASVGEVATLGADLVIGTDSSNYVIINSRIRSNLIPDVASFYTIGNDDFPWKEIHIDGGEEHGGRVYFDASDFKYTGSSEDGSTYIIEGFTTVDFGGTDIIDTGDAYIIQGVFGSPTGTATDTPQIIAQSNTGDAIIRLEVDNDSTKAWDIRNDNSDDDSISFQYNGSTRFKVLTNGTTSVQVSPSNRGSTSAPDTNTIYANTIVKAWAIVDASGVLLDGVNLSVSYNAGLFTYTFLTAMSDDNYVVVATGDYGQVDHYLCTARNKVSTGFAVAIWGITLGLSNIRHSVMVIGQQ